MRLISGFAWMRPEAMRSRQARYSPAIAHEPRMVSSRETMSCRFTWIRGVTLPIRVRFPPSVVRSMARRTDVSVPTASSTTSASGRPTARRISAATSLAAGLIVTSAPSWRANFSRSSFTSRAMTIPAPLTRAACMAKRPICPAPTTATTSFTSIGVIRAACRLTAAGSISAASSNETASGNRCVIHQGTTTYSAMAPSLRKAGVETPRTFRFWHRFMRPWRHAGHWLQYTVESKVIRSPAARSRTFRPTASTTPAASCPMMMGGMRRPVDPV